MKNYDNHKVRSRFRKLLLFCMIFALSAFSFCVVASASESGTTTPAASGLGTVLTDFIDLLVGGIKNMASGLGEGINTYVVDLFLVTSSTGAITGLSAFGGIVAIFGGIALAVGITRLLFSWIRNIGG